jgi:hypothetical protein
MRFTLNADTTELSKALNKYPRILIENTVLALEIGARNIQNEARANHKFISRSGLAGLEGAVDTEVNETTLESAVGFNQSSVKYGEYIHEGTGLYGPKRKKYLIKPKNRKMLQFLKGGVFKYARKVLHPGIRPDPFIVRAAKNKYKETNDLFNRAVVMASRNAGLANG